MEADKSHLEAIHCARSMGECLQANHWLLSIMRYSRDPTWRDNLGLENWQSEKGTKPTSVDFMRLAPSAGALWIWH